MTTAVQHRRGTTSEHSTFTGLVGEVTIDTTKDTAVIHDGSLAGGYPLAKENLSNVTPTGLPTIDGASTASDDKFFIYDQSASVLKSITRAELNNAIEQDALANVAITGGTINGTTIGGTTAAAGAFTTLTTSGAVTHNGGTANGVAYLNGSKVLTTGSALTFDGTNLGIGATTPLQLLHLSSASPPGMQITYQGVGASRIGLAAGNALTFGLDTSNGATEQMRLTSTGLGIGTSSPVAKLGVAGNVFISGASPYIAFDTTQSGSTPVFIQYASSSLLFGAGSAERMRLDAFGNLGLGVTPSAWGSALRVLQIGYGSVSGYPSTTGAGIWIAANAYYDNTNWRYQSTSQATYYNQLSGTHSWFTAPSGTAGNAISFTQAMTLTPASELLVGGTNAYGKLAVYGTASATGYATYFSNSTSYQDLAGYANASLGNGTWNWEPGTVPGSGVANFYTRFKSRIAGGTTNHNVVIDGDLLVGTTGTAYGIGTFLAASGGNVLGVSSAGAVDGTRFIRFNVNTSTEVGNVTTNGTSTAYNTTSDYRLKDNIAPMTGALARVAALKPCIYKWKADGSDGEGFIAHELAEVVPQCVTGEKDAVDAEGKPVYQGIDTSFLVATLTAALQEAHGLIKNLQARVAALEAA